MYVNLCTYVRTYVRKFTYARKEELWLIKTPSPAPQNWFPTQVGLWLINCQNWIPARKEEMLPASQPSGQPRSWKGHESPSAFSNRRASSSMNDISIKMKSLRINFYWLSFEIATDSKRSARQNNVTTSSLRIHEENWFPEIARNKIVG